MSGQVTEQESLQFVLLTEEEHSRIDCLQTFFDFTMPFQLQEIKEVLSVLIVSVTQKLWMFSVFP